METKPAQESPSAAQADLGDTTTPSAGHHPDPNDLDQELVDSFGRLLNRLGEAMATDDQGMAVWGMKAFDDRWEPLPPFRPSELPKVNRRAVKKSFDPARRINVYFRYPLFCGEAPSGTEKEAVAVPALVSDFDGGTWTTERVLDALTLPPSFIIETTPGNFQAHLILDRPVDVATARHFATQWNKPNSGVDGASFNPVQAWRVPGSINWGSTKKIAERPDTYPYQTRLGWSPDNALPDEVDPVLVDALLESWGDAPSLPTVSPLPGAAGSDESDTRGGSGGGGGVIANTDPRCTAGHLLGLLREGERLSKPVFEVPDDRAVWIAGATGIKADCGEHGREFFHAWSALSDKYDREEADREWDSLRPNGSKGVGHLFDQARANGFTVSPQGGVNGPGSLNGIEAMIKKALANDANAEASGQEDAHSTPSLLALRAWDNWDLRDMPHDFVEDTLTDGGFSVVYGDSNVGKSFWVADLAVHVAAGLTWAGREVDQRGVLYIASEGGGAFGKRVEAIRKERGLTGLPFVTAPEAVNLIDKGEAERVIETWRHLKNQGNQVGLIIVDTLSRSMPGANENAPEAMTAFIENCDQIRRDTGAHVLIIHHTGKNPENGARGHSSLKGAVDTEISIKSDGVGRGVAEMCKQRDLEKWQELMSFRLVPVKVGTNTRGKPLTSCVVEHTGFQTPIRKSDAAQTPAQSEVLEAILAKIEADGVDVDIGGGISTKGITVEETRQVAVAAVKASSSITGDGAKPSKVWERQVRPIIGRGALVDHEGTICRP
jgi:hypothetical protein